MAVIRSSVATTAGTYCSFVILTSVCIYDFSAPTTRLPVNLTYGVTLVFLSLINLLLGFTSQDHKECLLRAFQLCSSCMWASIGVYHITESLQPRYLTDTEALFGGYGAFLLIFILLVIGGLLHRAKFAAVISLGYALSCIFEIASLWRPLRASAAAYYILLAALTLYYSISNVLQRFRQVKKKDTLVKEGLDLVVSRDYIILGHAMNTLAFAIYAGHITGIYSAAHKEFHWVLVAGLFQCVAGLVAVRRNNAFNGGYFLIHGIFWLSNGYNLTVEHITRVTVYPLVAVSVLLIITFLLIALSALTKEIFQVIQNLSLAVFCVALTVNGSKGSFVGGISWVSFILSLYGMMAHITRIETGSYKLPLGSRVFEAEKFKQIIIQKYRLFAGCFYGQLKEVGKGSTLYSTSQMLGYSKYLDLDMVGFAVNAVSALSILWVPKGVVILPWVVLFGGIPQFIVGSVSFSRGLTFESCAFFTFGSLWTIWGSVKGLGILDLDHSIAAAAGCIAFIAVGVLLLGLATVISVSWVVLTILYILLVVGFLLQTLSVTGIDVYLVVISIAFAAVCIYCFLASVMKSVMGRSLLPTGKPIVQVSYLHSQGDKALWCDARRASGVKHIAEILNQGGICGVPTDVVYVLVAAMKYPKAVERAYETKKLAEDRPMSMWISKREQLEAGKEEFGDLLWDFMKEVWPSTISLVIKKGPWVQSLGVDFAEKYIGRADSIAVRMPDNTVTSHLIDQVGPISVSSANPTGEADTTHHLQVLAKLGIKNCDGILCAGPSPENAASTVVDCRKINEGKLGFFRIGIVPKSRVEELFEKVQSQHKSKCDIPATISHVSDNSSDSGVCGSDKSYKSDKKNVDDHDDVINPVNSGEHNQGSHINHAYHNDKEDDGGNINHAYNHGDKDSEHINYVYHNDKHSEVGDKTDVYHNKKDDEDVHINHVYHNDKHSEDGDKTDVYHNDKDGLNGHINHVYHNDKHSEDGDKTDVYHNDKEAEAGQLNQTLDRELEEKKNIRNKHVETNGGITTIHITKEDHNSTVGDYISLSEESNYKLNSENDFQRDVNDEILKFPPFSQIPKSEPVYQNQPSQTKSIVNDDETYPTQTSSVQSDISRNGHQEEQTVIVSQEKPFQHLDDQKVVNSPTSPQLSSKELVRAAHEIGGRPSPTLSVRFNPVFEDGEESTTPM